MHPAFDKRARKDLILKIINWAQKNKVKIENLTKSQVEYAIRCKP